MGGWPRRHGVALGRTLALCGRTLAVRGIRRRLATFDGTLAVISPPGGPTMMTVEVPVGARTPGPREMLGRLTRWRRKVRDE